MRTARRVIKLLGKAGKSLDSEFQEDQADDLLHRQPALALLYAAAARSGAECSTSIPSIVPTSRWPKAMTGATSTCSMGRGLNWLWGSEFETLLRLRVRLLSAPESRASDLVERVGCVSRHENAHGRDMRASIAAPINSHDTFPKHSRHAAPWISQSKGRAGTEGAVIRTLTHHLISGIHERTVIHSAERH